jgi:hypothetical protein
MQTRRPLPEPAPGRHRLYLTATGTSPDTWKDAS